MLWLSDISFKYAFLHIYEGKRRTSNIVKISQNLRITLEEFKDLISPFNPYYTNDSETWEKVVGFKKEDVEGVQNLLDSINVIMKLTK